MSELWIDFRYLIKPIRLVNLYRHIKQNMSLKKKQSYLAIGAVLNNSVVEEKVWIGEDCNVSNSNIGRHTYVGSGTRISNSTIGRFCSIAEHSVIGLGKHPTNMVSTHPAFYSNQKPFTTFADRTYVNETGKNEIGNDVWIGRGATIMPDVKIGDGAIIASGAVITKDVEPYAIVGGVPGKLIRFRFSQDIIDKLQKSKWWDFDEDYYLEHFMDFHDPMFFLKTNATD